MKEALTLALVCLFLHGSVVAQERNDREADGLKGPVKELRAATTSYSNRSGEWVSEHTEIETRSYSTQGGLLIYSRQDPDGSLAYRYAYSYNPAGRLAECKHFVAGGSLADVAIYTYNDEGRLESVIHKASDGQVHATATYKHNRRGKKVGETYMTQDSFLTKGEWIYDDAGTLRESLHTSGYPDHLLRKKSVYTYAPDGKLEKLTLYRLGEKPIVEQVRTYDANERVAEFIVYSGIGAVEYREVNEYDGHGNQTVQARYNGDGVMVSRTATHYEYGRFGNWTKQVEETARKDGGPYRREVTERHIAYYD